MFYFEKRLKSCDRGRARTFGVSIPHESAATRSLNRWQPSRKSACRFLAATNRNAARRPQTRPRFQKRKTDRVTNHTLHEIFDLKCIQNGALIQTEILNYVIISAKVSPSKVTIPDHPPPLQKPSNLLLEIFYVSQISTEPRRNVISK